MAHYLAENVCVNQPFDDFIVFKHRVLGDPLVVSLDWRQKARLGPLFQQILDFVWRKALVRHNDPFPDVVVSDERWASACVDAVARKDFRADRFHELDVISIQHGYFPAFLQPRLVGECGKVIHHAGVLLQRPVDRDVVFFHHLLQAHLAELSPLLSVLAKLLLERAYGVI
jgi:hypothetical protein